MAGKKPRKKAGDNQVKVGNITRVSGKVTIAGGDVYEGYTAKQVSVLLTEITSNYKRKPFDGRCPYKGLEVFEEEDAELFFGRERLVEDLIARVKESRTVFITGPSGSGKSSLVRAGLIHALKQGAIKNSKSWLYETIKPGREPIKELSLTFLRLKSPELSNYFQAHANEVNILNECAESVLTGRKDQCFVLFVDQFEEVFTQVSQEEERQAFINMLAHAATLEKGRVIVLFAMRSDFVSNCAIYPALNELLSQEFRQIGAMQPEELVSAIVLPAKQVGLPIEDDLTARIINDMKGEPGALPLMQFALKDLFDSQKEKGGIIALTLEDYLRHGGIHKALERHADHTFTRLNEGEQELARSIFSSLIEIGRGTADTRRTALFDELVPADANRADILAVVQKLADARLIITDEQAGKDTVTISHEKLIDAWPWLRKLVNENRDAIALQNEIASDAKEWDDHHKDASYLYSGPRLVNALEQLESKKLVLSGLAQEFVRAGGVRQRRTQTTLIAGVSVIIALLFLAVIVFSNQSIRNANSASTAEAASTDAVAQKATAQAASTLAVEKAEESQKQTDIALARQLAAQAQSINAIRNSKQMITALLAVQSMNIFPSSEAALFLLNNNFAAHSISCMTHDDNVNSVAFSPDGKYVVSGSDDNTARVWDALTGKEVIRMTYDGLVDSVAFTPDGKYVISENAFTLWVWDVSNGREVAHMTKTGSITSIAFSLDSKHVLIGNAGGSAYLWEIATGKEVARMTHDDIVNSVAFSPDGKYVVSGSDDNTARVWEIATGKEVARMTHENRVESVAFSPGGKYVLSGSLDGTARVWEASTGIEVARVTHDDLVTNVAFSPDGKYVVSSYIDARVWEAISGKETARMTHDYPIPSIAFSPDGKYVVSGSYDNTARVWETNTGLEVARMTHDDSVNSVAFSPDGKYVVSGSRDATACVWKVTITKEIARMTYEEAVLQVEFSPDGKHILSENQDQAFHVRDVSTGQDIVHRIYDELKTSAFSPDGRYVVSGGCDELVINEYSCTKGSVDVWETMTGKDIAHIAHNNFINSVAFSPDGKYVVSGSDDTARVWEITTVKEVARMIHDDFVTSVAFSPDGKYVVSGCRDDTARVWDALTGEEVARMKNNSSSVSFSPDGRYVLSRSVFVGGGHIVIVWDALTGIEVARMSHGDVWYDPVNSVAFSPDGKHVVSGSGDDTARVWDALTGEEVARMTHDDNVTSVAFSPDSKYVVSGSLDKTARVWESTTGKEVARMSHDDFVTSVAFSPDGRYVVSGSYDSTIRVWIYRSEDLIADACSRLPRNLTRQEWKQYIGDALPYQSICPNLPIEPEVLLTPNPTP